MPAEPATTPAAPGSVSRARARAAAPLVTGLRVLIWATGVGILGYASWGLATGTLGTDPVREYQLATGEMTLRFLLASLAVTPLRRLTGRNDLIRVRRLLGLWAFAFGVVHLLSYAVFDQELSPAGIAADIVKHPWVLAGFASLLVMLPLAVTSTQGWIRRLGRRWQALHRLAYAAAALGVLHFFWLVKKDLTEPLIYGAVFAALMLLRRVPARRTSQAARV